MKHLIDKTCNCPCCTKIDMLWGDPVLSPWEKKFIQNLSQYGWIANYTTKQISKLEQIWHKIHRIRKIPTAQCS